MKIVFTGGGTLGHLYPLLAVIKKIKEIDVENKIELLYIGSKDREAEIFFQKQGVIVKKILSGKLRRYFSLKNLIDLFIKIPIGFVQSFINLFIISPDLIFSKGGYSALPVVLAGRLLSIPVFLHESDAVLGITNKITSHFASKIFLSFENRDNFLPKEKIILTGNPVREEILKGEKARAKNFFKLTGEKPVILIMGGSQGAKAINECLFKILKQVLKEAEIIHLTGKNNFDDLKKISGIILSQEEKRYYHCFSFLKGEKLADAYAVSDLIISRAGAGAIFEIAALGKPSVLIPLPNSAQDHQLKNANFYAKAGAAMVVEQSNFTPQFFLEIIKDLFNNKEKLKKMSQKAKEFSKPKAGEIIANYLYNYLEKTAKKLKK